MYKRAFLPALYLSLVFLFGPGCGGGASNNGGGNNPPGINVQVVAPVGAAALDANQTLPITVTVNDSAGVTWAVAPAQNGGPTGTLTNQQPTSATYNPPANLTSSMQVKVTATSVTDPTRSAAIPISVYPTPAITTQSSDLAAAFVNTDYNCIQMPITSSGVIQIPCAVNVAGGLGPYTWSLGNTLLPDGMQLAPGQTQNSTEIIGPPTTSGIYSFTLTATDSLGATTTVSLNINVAPKQLKVVTPTLLSTTTGVPYAPVQLQASGGAPPYLWSLAPGSGPLPPGMTLSPSGVISGTPENGNGYAFALQVMDSQSPVPAQAVYPAPQPTNPKIIILSSSGLDPGCQTGGNALQADTPYAFLFSGFDADGPVTISGSFTSDNSGNLTGEEDIIRTSGAQTSRALTSGSSIVFNQVGRGCLTLNTGSSSAQFRVAPTTQDPDKGFFRDGRIVEFDDSNGSGTRGTGFFRIQDSTAFSTSSIAGPYAFRFSGWDAGGSRFAMAGTATAQSGLFSSVAADVNDGGAISGALNGGSGTIGSVDANGRGTATIGVGTATYDFIFYVVDANHLIFNSTQAAASGHPLITGEATTAAGPFSQATLSDSHIYRFAGYIPGSPDVGIGVLHFDGAGALSGTSYERSGGSASATTLSGQYAIDPTTGRFTFSGTGVAAVGYAVPATSGITGYLVGTGPSAASGVLEFQTSSYPPGYQFSPINGRYGFASDEALDPQTTNFAGQEQDGPNGGMSPDSYIDTSGPAAPGVVPEQSFALFQYTWSADGTGTYGGNTYMVSNGAKVFYIDISPLNGHPAVVVGQRQQ